MLFISGFIFSCNSSKEMTAKKTAAAQQEIKLPDSLSRKQASGIDFFAEGNLPVEWTVDMDMDNGYYFKTADGRTFNIPAVKATRASGIAADNYSYSTRQGDMSILVYDVPCSNASGKKVEVTLNSIRYTGCGADLYNAAINDTWILEKTGSSTLNAKDFPKGLPKIAFSIAENKMTGSDGCSTISVPIQMMGSRIKFSEMSGADGSCKNDVIRKIFTEKMANHIADYYFRDGKLYLYLVDDSTLVFRKA